MDECYTVDWVVDDEITNREKLSRVNSVMNRSTIMQSIREWVALGLSGILVGCASVLISQATSLLADFRDGYCRSNWYLNESLCCLGEAEGCKNWAEYTKLARFPIYLLFSLLFAGTASYIVSVLAPTAAGSGISEIKCIVSGFFAPKFLNAQTLALKVLALPLTIASGFSVGKEGPSVHYAACIGSVVSKKTLNIEENRKYSDLITAGCAAGVAVAFGSPIGGVLFAFEEIAYELRLATLLHAYFCSLIATSVVKLLNPFRTGQVVLFKVEYDRMWHAFELPFFVIIGVFGGIMGHWIIKTNLRIVALRKRFWGRYCVAEALVIAALTTVFCYFNMYLHPDMTKSMQILFHECEHGQENHASCDANNRGGIMLSLAYAFVVRSLLLVVSYGAAKVPAGIFVPSLAIGAIFGRFIGVLVWSLLLKFPNSKLFSSCEDVATCVNPGSYALLGAGALLAGVMHITLTVVVVIFEVTGAVHYIIPTMIVVGITRLIGTHYGESGIADMAITVNGLPYIEAEEDHADARIAEDIMKPASEVVSARSDQGLLDDCRYRTYPILNAENELVGAVVDKKMLKSPITVMQTTSIDSVRALFVNLGPHTIYVTSNGKFAGLITRRGFFEATKGEGLQPTNRETELGTRIQKFFEKITFSS